MARIAVIGLGGTISMSSSGAGLVPTHGIAALLDHALAGGALEGVEVVAQDLAGTPSANLGWSHLADLRRTLRAFFAEGGRGAVVVQGTDVLEEMAFATELLGPGGGPVVFTGAMRGAGQPGGDGPANLLNALRIAAQAPRDLGVVVALDATVHAARRVRKAHTTALGAFTSGEAGPLGVVHEGRLELFSPPLPPLPAPELAEPVVPAVPIIPILFDMAPEMLAPWAGLDAAGFVVEAFGAGHTPERLVEGLAALAARAPTVLCSRIGDGRVAEQTYGYAGSERDLLARGLIPGGRMGVVKARLALQVCLAARPDAPAAAFAAIAEAVR